MTVGAARFIRKDLEHILAELEEMIRINNEHIT